MRKKLLAFMRETAYKPLTAEELIEIFEVKDEELTKFWNLIHELEQNGDIIRTRTGRYGIPERMDLVVGRLQGHHKGFGFIIPENKELADVFIAANAMNGAMHNDRVITRVYQATSPDKRAEGEIIRILERSNETLVGVFESSRHFGFVTPDDTRMGQDIFIPKDEFNGAKSGMKVVVTLTRWPEKRRNPEGKITEIIGYKEDPGVDILSIIKQHGLPLEFPGEVVQEAEQVPLEVQSEELNDRLDLRNLRMVTIDSEDAKDLDDAVSIEKLESGNYKLGVHIADVTHYVREGTPLDKEAQHRGTSVYLVDRVIPMLPKRLSNGICSLNAKVDRLALTAFMEINRRGDVVAYSIHESVIHVAARMTYKKVTEILEDKETPLRQEYAGFIPDFEMMEELRQILRKRRMQRGAIDFDFPELKVKVDDQGKPLAILKRERSLADSLIEEFMLVANETVAEHAAKLQMPFVYRVHEDPEEEKMVNLNELLHNFGYHLKTTQDVQPAHLQQILGKIAGQPEERIISTIMLRSMKQARYEPDNLGHFGLAAEYYTHFTSPIRRYPDLMIHRILRESIRKELSTKRATKLEKMLPDITFHSSERERAAADAERETVKLKIVEYMEDKIGEEYTGIISGVTSFGMFVELESGVEGLVHVSSMADDYYHFLEKQYTLLGERTKKAYRIGDTVRVKVTQLNKEERTIDFILAGMEDDGRRYVNRRTTGAVAPGKRTTEGRQDKPKGQFVDNKPKRSKKPASSKQPSGKAASGNKGKPAFNEPKKPKRK
jgi:ribonuclease R